MESLYQVYKNHVNFGWVYGSEAHPEENPFMEGYESKDLGWSHPYTFSTSMEQRAERAAWMKSDPDPDFEIPMLIDYVGHDTMADNAIRSAYRGSGYYSAYVIDCDGIVKRTHTWGWYDEGGEWWDLPLASADELVAWLDAYLANPPACYQVQEPPPDPPEDLGPDPADNPGAHPPELTDDSGCAVAGPSGRRPPAWFGLLFGLALWRRRRSIA